MTRQKHLLIASILLITSGCSFIEMSESGKKARVLDRTDVSNCQLMGTTTVNVIDKVAGLNRPAQTVQKELEQMARNAAGDLQGDTVVPVSEVQDGHQTFEVYRCIQP